jgi:hypothetical protein
VSNLASIQDQPYIQVIDKESSVRSINNAIFIFYILMFLEGMLRKWVAPQLSSAFFFIKDPVLLYMYYICWKKRMFPKTVVFQCSVILSVIFFMVAMTQMLIYTSAFFISVYGWRSYFMFMPLAFIMQKHMTKKDVIRIAKFTCLIGIPIAILCYIQYMNPPEAFINRNAGENSGVGFTVIGDIVRPYGPFSFVTGMSFFTSSYLLMILYNFMLNKKEKFLSPTLLFFSFASFITALAVSGSRETFIKVIILVPFAMVGYLMLYKNKKTFNSLIIFIVVGAIAIVAYFIIFSKEVEIMNERVEVAEAVEGSVFTRATHSFISFEDIDMHLNFLGVGIGLGSSGGSFLQSGIVQFNIAESDWGKIIVECGVFFGFLYLAYRALLCIYMSVMSIKATFAGKSPMPMILIGYEFHTMLIGQMVSTGIHLAYGWFFLGFTLALNNIYIKEGEQNSQGNI